MGKYEGPAEGVGPMREKQRNKKEMMGGYTGKQERGHEQKEGG